VYHEQNTPMMPIIVINHDTPDPCMPQQTPAFA
jgi:hypothetical protein